VGVVVGSVVGPVRAAAGRHPRWVDAAVAAATAVVGLSGGAGEGPPGPGVAGGLWFVAVHAPLVWRRRAPVAVFWVALALAGGAALVTGVRVQGLYPEAALLVALHGVARYRPPRQLWPAVAVLWLPSAAVLLATGAQWTALGLVTTALAAAVLLGVATRTRLAYLGQLAERARRLEVERDQRAALAVAAERSRIAREMHDIVAHNLAVMVALADGAAMTAATAPRRSAEAMTQVADTGRQALTEMRRLLGLLRADGDGRGPQPGLADLDDLLAQVRAAGVRVEITRTGAPGAYGAGAGLAVYRIVQEALTNTLKHAGPGARAHVRLEYAADGVDLEVSDDGGSAPRPAGAGGEPAGHGLAGMRERAAAYGGDVRAGPRPDRPGWLVRARLRPRTVAAG
jgi:signal transduction histidine kinase